MLLPPLPRLACAVLLLLLLLLLLLPAAAAAIAVADAALAAAAVAAVPAPTFGISLYIQPQTLHKPQPIHPASASTVQPTSTPYTRTQPLHLPRLLHLTSAPTFSLSLDFYPQPLHPALPFSQAPYFHDALKSLFLFYFT